MLWIAFNLYICSGNSQDHFQGNTVEGSCELLSICIFVVVTHKRNRTSNQTTKVVNCFQFVYL